MANASIPYIIAEDGFYYVAYKEKVHTPEIVVSAKGVANGLSEEYNDGWDFGPDSYSPTSTSAIPYTETSGVQEAVQYKIFQGGGKILIKGGHYIVSAGAPFSLVGQVYNNVVGAHVDVYALINLNSTNVTGIEIEGIPKALPATGGNGTVIPFDYGGVVIDLSNVSLPSSTATYVVFGAINTSTITNPIKISGIQVMAPVPINFGHTIIANASSSSIEYCSIRPVPSEQNFITGTPASNEYQISFHIGGQAGNASWANMLYAQQTYTAFQLTAHSVAGTLISQSNIIGIQTNTGYIGDILHFDVQGTQYPVYNTVSDISLHIFGWLEEDYSAVSNVTSQFKTLYDVYDPNNGLTLIVEMALINRDNASNNVPPKINGYFNKIFRGFGRMGNGLIFSTPSISANPPVTGTVYQNTNGFDIEIDLPVYATTSGTAGYVTLAKSSTDTPTAIANQYISGDTSDTSEQIIRLRVPAGWYYSFTESGVTFGTASVFAD